MLDKFYAVGALHGDRCEFLSLVGAKVEINTFDSFLWYCGTM